jgi:hypothetical protein
MPKGKNGKSGEATRSFAFKVRNLQSDSANKLIEDVTKQNLIAASIHRIMALFLGLCDEKRTDRELKWLEENAEFFYRQYLETRKKFSAQELEAAAFLIAQFGAQSKDAFFAFAHKGKKADSLLKSIRALKESYTGFWKTDKNGSPVIKDGEKVWIKGSIEKARETYQARVQS